MDRLLAAPDEESRTGIAFTLAVPVANELTGRHLAFAKDGGSLLGLTWAPRTGASLATVHFLTKASREVSRIVRNC